MSTNKSKKHKANDTAPEFPGATGDQFGNQYFDKQGTEHSSHAPYEHEHDSNLDQEKDERSKDPRHPTGTGNKDEYQAGKTAPPAV